MKKDYLKFALLAFVALALIGGISYAIRGTTPEPSNPSENAGASEAKSATVTLSVEGVYEGKQVAVLEGETALAVLERLNTEDPALKLSTKTYAGLGVLVDGMGTLKNGTDTRYWQYDVNGVMPQIGADKYELKAGDKIVWRFAESAD